jgi:hypothetical protein
MARWFECPYLGGEVELTDEREVHILTRHPDVLPDNIDRISETLSQPEAVRVSPQDADARLFGRWYDDFLDGKYLNVVVKLDPTGRNWILTAHPSESPVRGEVLWART